MSGESWSSSDDLRQFTPQPPDWKLDWYGLDMAYAWIQRMRECPQSPVYHAEGDVWIHTRMVLEELIQLPAWRGLDAVERELLFCAAALHDVGKPATTRVEGGHITSRGHSQKGARMARRILWEMGFAPPLREAIASLIRYHQLPYYLVDRHDGLRMAIEISQTARTDYLTILAEADVRGRICRDLPRLLDNIELFGEFCREHECWAAPRPFANAHSRFLYFRNPSRDPNVEAAEYTRCEMVLMAGLPGAGKDAWLAASYRGPVVAANELQVAREQAKVRLEAGENFAWNAINIARELRAHAIELAAAYQARLKIVWVEAPRTELWERNRMRPNPISERVIESMLDRWETPDLCEAHEVQRIG
jgi:putative nucleotidyltransferase with HDIG domain